MMRALSALALFATASAVPDMSNKLAGVVVGHMQELNLQQVRVPSVRRAPTLPWCLAPAPAKAEGD